MIWDAKSKKNKIFIDLDLIKHGFFNEISKVKLKNFQRYHLKQEWYKETSRTQHLSSLF